jgi:hypothetical protein
MITIPIPPPPTLPLPADSHRTDSDQALHSLTEPVTMDPPVPIEQWFFLVVKGPVPNSFILSEWFEWFKSEHLIGIGPPTETKPLLLSFKLEYQMNQVSTLLNLDMSGIYNAHKCVHDASTISLSIFQYIISPMYVAELYANHHSICQPKDLLKYTPPVMELHLIDMTVPGSRTLQKQWKYQFLDQLKYPPVPTPHPSLNLPSHQLQLCKLSIIQFSPMWLRNTLEWKLKSSPCSIHWHRLALLMCAHVASFLGHIAHKFVVPLCRTNGPYNPIIHNIASWAAEQCRSSQGLVQQDHEHFGFIDGMWRLELELNLPVPQYYIQDRQSLESLL